MKGDNIAHRVYFLWGGAAKPGVGDLNGIKSQIGDKEIDLTILCIASHAYVDDYPESILTSTPSKYVFGVHWEDFFTDYFEPGNKKAVRFTCVPAFFDKMDKMEKYKGKWGLASPLVKVKFKY